MTIHAKQIVPYNVSESDFEDYISFLLEDTAPACISIPVALAAETAELVTSAGLHPGASAGLAELLDQPLLGDVRLLNLNMCQAAWLLLDAASETGLPFAARAEQLAATFRNKYEIQS